MFRITPATAEVFGGQPQVQAFLDDQRKIKNGRVEKTKVNQGVRGADGVRRNTHVEKKKGVNNFLLFRSKFMLSRPIATFLIKFRNGDDVVPQPTSERAQSDDQSHVGARAPQNLLGLDGPRLDIHQGSF